MCSCMNYCVLMDGGGVKVETRDRMMSILSADNADAEAHVWWMCDGFAMSDCLLTISDRCSCDISIFLDVLHVFLIIACLES